MILHRNIVDERNKQRKIKNMILQLESKNGIYKNKRKQRDQNDIQKVKDNLIDLDDEFKIEKERAMDDEELVKSEYKLMEQNNEK